MGYLPRQEELQSIDVMHLMVELRKKYPTIEDIRKDLTEAVNKSIGVVFQQGWTQEQYEQAIREKQAQYREAVHYIVSVLSPVYEKFGAVPSEENRKRIIENLATIVEKIIKIDHRDILSVPKDYVDYVKENLRAAINQNWSPEEISKIIQFFETYQQAFPGGTDPEVESLIKKIKEKSGLVLQKSQEELRTSGEERPLERFELKNTKQEIEYWGLIDIYLANKHLQIIDVRNDPRKLLM